MKKIFNLTLQLVVLILVSCGNEFTPVKLNTPEINQVELDEITWEEITGASFYELEVNGRLFEIESNTFIFNEEGDYDVRIRAISNDLSKYINSSWSERATYTYLLTDYTGVIILPTTYLELNYSDTYEILETLIPEKDFEIFVTSSNSEVIEVNDKILEARGIGESIITVSTRQYQQAKMLVKVFPKILVGFTGDINVEVGDLHSLEITVLPALEKDEYLTFTSSNPNTVFIGNTGIINALKAGSSIITITSLNGGKHSFNVTTSIPEPAVVTFSVTLPEALPEGFDMYITGSFNEWGVKDQNYKMKVDPNNPLRHLITITTFDAKTELQYKYIMGSATEYNWENYQNSPMANRSLYVGSGLQTLNDTIQGFQETNIG